MVEERLTPAWMFVGAIAAACIVGVPAWFWLSLSALAHDKSLNSRLQVPWSDPRALPLGTVVPANSRWMDNAFIADRSDGKGKGVKLLILDDHYRGSDPSYRSESGVIGDRISRATVCSIPSQARAKKVDLDPVVQRLIAAECPQTLRPQ